MLFTGVYGLYKLDPAHQTVQSAATFGTRTRSDKSPLQHGTLS